MSDEIVDLSVADGVLPFAAQIRVDSSQIHARPDRLNTYLGRRRLTFCGTGAARFRCLSESTPGARGREPAATSIVANVAQSGAIVAFIVLPLGRQWRRHSKPRWGR